MALSDYISQRIYDAFRIKGVAENSQVDGVTVAVNQEINGEQVSETNPLATSSADLIATQLETDNETLNLLNDVLSELRIMNTYNALAHNQELTKEDLG